MEHQQQSYIAYLQTILKERGIYFASYHDFVIESGSGSGRKGQGLKEIKKGPLETNMEKPLVGELLSRYSRQMLLKEIKYQGQVKICGSRVALIGSGGIGCPTGLYLAGAGVGTLGLFDSDVVDVTNLHRQVGHNTRTLGVPKTASLKQTLLALNPNIQVNEHPFITVQTLKLLDDYDLVIDGSDNPQCRYLVNDYLMSKGKRLLSGACVGWEGQITCYGGQEGPCYRCIWGDDQVSMGGCSTLGVIGMLPGFVGMILGVEALKMIVQGKSSLEGFLLTYEGKSCQFRKMKLRTKKQECKACGAQKLDIPAYDYSRYGTCKPNASNLPEVPSMSWEQYISQSGECPLVDVRARAQYDIVHLKNSLNIPYEELVRMSKEDLEGKLGNSRDIRVMCKSGIMSRRATDYLIKSGIESVVNVTGGINGYAGKYEADIPDV